MTFRSPFVQHALDLRAEVRDRYDEYLNARYLDAERVCRGRMLNGDGERAGVDPMDLFLGTEARAQRYASEELIEYWRNRPRMTFEEFERQAFIDWRSHAAER